ncbi:hypothetical protein BBJK_00726 [Bifidobacterium bifidum LMG 13195]|uniref:Uncharacterized protein n=1 Tax=Bifidobacterium bifidum LMG 13195 TaxID=1207542 RepID=A0A286TBE0_BIFBI|nr:hypothetical protein BBJK_00726 [Bifidobacterium bifidum LMG 13195]
MSLAARYGHAGDPYVCASTSVWPVTPYRCPAIPQPVTGDGSAPS